MDWRINIVLKKCYVAKSNLRLNPSPNKIQMIIITELEKKSLNSYRKPKDPELLRQSLAERVMMKI